MIYPRPTGLSDPPTPTPPPPTALSILYPTPTGFSALRPSRAVYPLPHPAGLLCPYLGAFVLVPDRVNPGTRTLLGVSDTSNWVSPPPGSIVVRASARGVWFDLRLRHTKDVKNGRFVLLSLALGINELGIRLGSSESV